MWILLCVSTIFDAIAITKKKASITLLQFKNSTQEMDFLKIRQYANSVLTTHFFSESNIKMLCASSFQAS